MEWARQTEARITAVFRGAVESLARDMTQTKPNGGRVPVKQGNLYRSLLMSTTAMPTRADSKATFTADPVFDVIGLKIGDVVYLGYQAAHAARQNYGFVGADSLGRVYNQAGSGFLEAAHANWPSILEAEAAYVYNKVSG
jgi:hypothetical protein